MYRACACVRSRPPWTISDGAAARESLDGFRESALLSHGFSPAADTRDHLPEITARTEYPPARLSFSESFSFRLLRGHSYGPPKRFFSRVSLSRAHQRFCRGYVFSICYLNRQRRSYIYVYIHIYNIQIYVYTSPRVSRRRKNLGWTPWPTTITNNESRGSILVCSAGLAFILFPCGQARARTVILGGLAAARADGRDGTAGRAVPITRQRAAPKISCGSAITLGRELARFLSSPLSFVPPRLRFGHTTSTGLSFSLTLSLCTCL